MPCPCVSITKEIPMPRSQYYSPTIERFLVTVLYHEARHRKIPMTQLVNEIVKDGLANSTGWQMALQSFQSPGSAACCQTKRITHPNLIVMLHPAQRPG